ncbi:MAG: hypothetical protein EBX41_04735, partial [Chitinophagia bacterium]|nr:hypothetical protein [Chitinophagia bacterium]
ILFNRLELMVNSFVGSIFIYKSHVTIFPILLARKGEYFIAGYDVIDNKEMKEVMPPQLMQEEQVSELLKVQPAHVSALTIDKALLPYLFELRGNHVLIIGEVDFKFWGCYVRERYDVKMFDDLYHSEPSYLKDVYFSTKS